MFPPPIPAPADPPSDAVTLAHVALHDPDFRRAHAAARRMREAGIDQAAGVQALAEGLRHPDPVVRRRAAQALSQVGPAAVLVADGLRDGLRDPMWTVREAVVEALAALPFDCSAARADLLGCALQDRSPLVRDLAGRAAVRLGLVAPLTLESALGHPYPKVRRRAVELLDCCPAGRPPADEASRIVEAAMQQMAMLQGSAPEPDRPVAGSSAPPGPRESPAGRPAPPNPTARAPESTWSKPAAEDDESPPEGCFAADWAGFVQPQTGACQPEAATNPGEIPNPVRSQASPPKRAPRPDPSGLKPSGAAKPPPNPSAAAGGPKPGDSAKASPEPPAEVLRLQVGVLRNMGPVSLLPALRLDDRLHPAAARLYLDEYCASAGAKDRIERGLVEQLAFAQDRVAYLHGAAERSMKLEERQAYNSAAARLMRELGHMARALAEYRDSLRRRSPARKTKSKKPPSAREEHPDSGRQS